jgi:hypothetical protein
MYWSDVSKDELGLTLITHGLQGVSGGATRGVMLVRQASGDNESVSDPGVHHLRYAYLPHVGNATDAQPWMHAYEFNQPLIVTWKTAQGVHVQLPFDGDAKSTGLENLENRAALPMSYSMLSAQDAVIADLYRQGDQLEAVILNYGPTGSASVQIGNQRIALPQSVFTLMPLPSLEIPSQK